jgi:hypothetical protein
MKVIRGLRDGSRQRRGAHQVRVDAARAAPAVGYRPDDRSPRASVPNSPHGYKVFTIRENIPE